MLSPPATLSEQSLHVISLVPVSNPGLHWVVTILFLQFVTIVLFVSSPMQMHQKKTLTLMTMKYLYIFQLFLGSERKRVYFLILEKGD